MEESINQEDNNVSVITTVVLLCAIIGALLIYNTVTVVQKHNLKIQAIAKEVANAG